MGIEQQNETFTAAHQSRNWLPTEYPQSADEATTLGIADHSELGILTWIFSPGLPIVLHLAFQISFSGWLSSLAVAGMTALLIDFVYYAVLVYAGLAWLANRSGQHRSAVGSAEGEKIAIIRSVCGTDRD